MISKSVKLKDKTIKVWERKGFLGRLQITEQKQKFDRDCNTLLVVFAKKAKVNKLPSNAQEVIDWIGQSYRNTEQSFTKRHPEAVVLDVDYVLDQLVK